MVLFGEFPLVFFRVKREMDLLSFISCPVPSMHSIHGGDW